MKITGQIKDITWADVSGYEGLYRVSNAGEVKRQDTGKPLKATKSRNGYLKVCLCKNGIKKSYSVHRLVAKTFLPNPDNLPEVNHKDQNKLNNSIFNLEWCTSQYNVDYSNSKQVNQYDMQGNFIKTWKSTKEIARELRLSNGNISNCCNGRVKSIGGYIWRYNNEGNRRC